MMMMMRRVMCVLAVVLCCACGYTMTAAATVNAGQPKAVMANTGTDWDHFLDWTSHMYKECMKNSSLTFEGKNCTELGFINKTAHPSTEVKSPEGAGANLSPEVSANGSQEERIVVLFEPITKAIYDEFCRNNSATIINGKNCSEVLKSLQAKTELPPGSIAASPGDQGVSVSTTDNSTPADSNLTQQPPATAPSASQETNSITPTSTENTTTEAPTATPSPEPNSDINTNVASTVKNKGNADSSLNPVWMRTAAPLLIVAVLFSVTVY
ncbi:uncharacterized protein TM35_000031590 [Trypanosoma theileri]|uniref:Mucin-like glycoprotein n=1 Tax=Trypanosoma theileri TaxID=67003 RepID=A0A1X0P640_9TRYP|nr:uncharacterized protein TM35_000031590 [Trypanosoma theileri]ORC92406.1 hypothetical protein TM35_000031590 [Trypanosoma theileri]